MKIFELIEKNRNGRDVRKLCDLYGVSRSGFYAWQSRPISDHRRHDLLLIETIKDVHQGFRRAYGAPRLYHLLRAKGFACSVRRINRLMRELGIKALSTGLYA